MDQALMLDFGDQHVQCDNKSLVSFIILSGSLSCLIHYVRDCFIRRCSYTSNRVSWPWFSIVLQFLCWIKVKRCTRPIRSIPICITSSFIKKMSKTFLEVKGQTLLQRLPVQKPGMLNWACNITKYVMALHPFSQKVCVALIFSREPNLKSSLPLIWHLYWLLLSPYQSCFSAWSINRYSC